MMISEVHELFRWMGWLTGLVFAVLACACSDVSRPDPAEDTRGQVGDSFLDEDVCGTSLTGDCQGMTDRQGDCIPDCAGRSCGHDGCGGSCGFCPEHGVCDGASCRFRGAQCDEVTGQGECFLHVLAMCVEEALVFMDCDALGRICQVNGGTGEAECVYP